MRAITFVVPGSIETRTGGYEYDRRMIAGLRALGWSVDVSELDDSFPNPTAGALDHAERLFAAIPDTALVVVDGLAFGAMPSIAERAAARLTLVAIVHLPLALAVGLDAERNRVLEASERRSLAAAALVVATGRSTAAVLIDRYGVAADRLVVVEPGTDPAPRARGSGDHERTHLLCVATISRGKGHEILIRALARVPRGTWRLICAGSVDRDPDAVARVRETIASTGLGQDVMLTGKVGELELRDLYDRADVFVLPTLYETYGMAVAEALARGLPVVSTTTGAIPDLVGTEAGVLVATGNEDALHAALAAVIGDPSRRERLRRGAADARGRLTTWDRAASELSAALERLTARERIAF